MPAPGEAATGAAVPRALRAAASRASSQPQPGAPSGGPPRHKHAWRLTSALGSSQHSRPTTISCTISGKSGTCKDVSGHITSRQRSRSCSEHRTPQFPACRGCGPCRGASRRPGCDLHGNASAGSIATWKFACFGRVIACSAWPGTAAGPRFRSGTASAACARWCCRSAEQWKGS